MNPERDGKDALRNIVRQHLGNAASDLFVKKSLAIIDESADNKESYMDAAVRVCKRTILFIDQDLGRKVYDSLVDVIEKTASPRGTVRRFRRVNCNMKVSIEYDGRRYDLDLVNLSEGGAFIKTKEPFPVGADLKMTLSLELGRPTNLAGMVIYNRNPSGETSRLPVGIGIKFKHLGADEVGALRNFVGKMPAEPLFQKT